MTIYKNKYFLPIMKFVQKGSSVSMKSVIESMNNNTSKKILFDRSQTPEQTLSLSFKSLTRAQAKEFINFYVAHRGRQVSFLLPSLFSDVEIVEGSGVGSTTLKINDTLFADVFLTNKNAAHFKTLAIIKSNGTIEPLTVTGSEAFRNDGFEVLTLEAPLNVNAAVGDFVCFLQVVRFANDSLTVNHLTQHMIDIDFQVVRLISENL